MATIFDQHFAEHRITQAQFRVLLAVENGGPAGIAPSILADTLLIERATVSVLTSRLVERGLLARQPGENRRTFNLALTGEGASLLHRIIPAAIALADRTLIGLDKTQLQELRVQLETLEAHLRMADAKNNT